jgi:hypothetical protein
MPVARDPLDALVSVWAHATTGPDQTPIGSGIFIAPRYVLTAKHVATAAQRHDGKIWLGNVRDKQDLIHVNAVHDHAHLDVALLELEMPNDRQPWSRVDLRKRDLKQQQVCLYGVLPHEKESTMKSGCTIMAYEETYGYYLTDYRHVEGFSGGVATIDSVIVGVINARYKEEDLGTIIPVSAAGEWLQGFPELRPSFLPFGGGPQPDTPITLIPRDTFTHKVRGRIRALLQRPHMQALHEAIGQRAGGQSAEDVLIPLQPTSLVEALDHLYHATKSCLQRLPAQQPEQIERMKHDIREIFGWQIVLVVNHDQVQESGVAFDPWQGGAALRCRSP